jgi:hypothetical protein
MDKTNYVQIFNKLYANKYDYSRMVYRTPYINVEIICPYHGSFYISPYHHSRKMECFKCMELTEYVFNVISKFYSIRKVIKRYKDTHIIMGFCKNHGKYLCTWEYYMDWENYNGIIDPLRVVCKNCVSEYKKIKLVNENNYPHHYKLRERVYEAFKKKDIKFKIRKIPKSDLIYDLYLTDYNTLILLDDVWINTLDILKDNPQISKKIEEYMYNHRKYAKENNFKYYVIQLDASLTKQITNILNEIDPEKFPKYKHINNNIKKGKSEPNLIKPSKSSSQSQPKLVSQPKLQKSTSQPKLIPPPKLQKSPSQTKTDFDMIKSILKNKSTKQEKPKKKVSFIEKLLITKNT